MFSLFGVGIEVGCGVRHVGIAVVFREDAKEGLIYAEGRD